MTDMAARLAYVNLFARNLDGLMGFYARLFGLREIAAHRSPIYRCLDAHGAELGFNAAEAYALLCLDDRRPAPEAGPLPLGSYFTVELDTVEAVDRTAQDTARR